MKDVIIHIKGRQFVVDADAGEAEIVELTTVGKMGARGGKTFLTYAEDPTLYGAEVTTTLKITGNDSVIMQRSGGSDSRLQIERGQRSFSHYETGYGSLMVWVFGEQIQNHLDEMGGRLLMSYTIDVESNLISRNELEITVKPAGGQPVS